MGATKSITSMPNRPCWTGLRWWLLRWYWTRLCWWLLRWYWTRLRWWLLWWVWSHHIPVEPFHSVVEWHVHDTKHVRTLLVGFNVVSFLGPRKCKALAFGSNVGLEMSTIRFVCWIFLEFELKPQSLETVFNQGRSYELDLHIG
jgi:hypothetical protein